MNARALNVRTQSSFLRFTRNPSSRAHFSTASFMSVLALLSFSPALALFFAWNWVPGPVIFNAEPTATATGSTSAQSALRARPVTFHCLALTCFSSTSLRSAR